MAILLVGLFERGREKKDEESGTVTVRNTYRVTSSLALEHEDTVLTAVDPNDGERIPQIRDTFVNAAGEPDGTLLVVNRTARQTDDIFVWEVEVEYSNNFLDSRIPWMQDPRVSYSSTQERRAAQHDANGRAYKNSAGLAFDPPPEAEESLIDIRIDKNQLTFDDAVIDANVNHVNSLPWKGRAAGTVRCTKIASAFTEEGEFDYWKSSYEFQVKRTGWSLRILDNGWETRNGTDPTKYDTIRDRTGDNRKGVPLLDGAGGRLEAAVTTLDGDAAAGDALIVLTDATKVHKTAGRHPLADNEYLEVGAEVVEIVAVTGNDVQVVRGAQGTTAADHLDGEEARLAPVFLVYQQFPEADFNLLNL